MSQLSEATARYHKLIESEPYIDLAWAEELREIIVRRLEMRAREICTGDRWSELESGVSERRIDPWGAADEMLKGVGA